MISLHFDRYHTAPFLCQNWFHINLTFFDILIQLRYALIGFLIKYEDNSCGWSSDVPNYLCSKLFMPYAVSRNHEFSISKFLFVASFYFCKFVNGQIILNQFAIFSYIYAKINEKIELSHGKKKKNTYMKICDSVHMCQLYQPKHKSLPLFCQSFDT